MPLVFYYIVSGFCCLMLETVSFLAKYKCVKKEIYSGSNAL